MSYLGLFLIGLGSAILYRVSFRSGYNRAMYEISLIDERVYIEAFRESHALGFVSGREMSRDIVLRMASNLNN